MTVQNDGSSAKYGLNADLAEQAAGLDLEAMGLVPQTPSETDSSPPDSTPESEAPQSPTPIEPAASEGENPPVTDGAASNDPPTAITLESLQQQLNDQKTTYERRLSGLQSEKDRAVNVARMEADEKLRTFHEERENARLLSLASDPNDPLHREVRQRVQQDTQIEPATISRQAATRIYRDEVIATLRASDVFRSMDDATYAADVQKVVAGSTVPAAALIADALARAVEYGKSLAETAQTAQATDAKARAIKAQSGPTDMSGDGGVTPRSQQMVEEFVRGGDLANDPKALDRIEEARKREGLPSLHEYVFG